MFLDVQDEMPSLNLASCSEVSDKELHCHYPGMQSFALEDAAMVSGDADIHKAKGETCAE